MTQLITVIMHLSIYVDYRCLLYVYYIIFFSASCIKQNLDSKKKQKKKLKCVA